MFNRKTEDIEELLDGVRELYGANSIESYGNWDDAQSVGFRIRGIPATFSVITRESLPEKHYNIQIEWYPPQDFVYLYHNRAIPLWEFLKLLKSFSGPIDTWPTMK